MPGLHDHPRPLAEELTARSATKGNPSPSAEEATQGMLKFGTRVGLAWAEARVCKIWPVPERHNHRLQIRQ